MIPGARLVVLGRQGAGKGTQCVRLARHYVVPHISTGDILRTAVKSGSELGIKAGEFMDRGDLLPDEIIIGIVEERLAQDDTERRGFVLDGFPRTLRQAESLFETLGDKGIDLAIDLDVPIDLATERLASRRVCRDCGTNYSTSVPPSQGWVCDSCGGDVIQRADDTTDAIKRRLELYDSDTTPLIEWFEERGVLAIVDGTGAPESVTTRLIDLIDSRIQT
ncbi:MAG TPA: adenylate kinase [Acidimicrobiales bacterium]